MKKYKVVVTRFSAIEIEVESNNIQKDTEMFLKEIPGSVYDDLLDKSDKKYHAEFRKIK